MDNIAKTNGKDAMMYTGNKPWHSKGTHVENAVTSSEAIELAGLNWNVFKTPVLYNSKNNIAITGEQRLFEDKFVTVREDTGDALGIVGKVYNVLQNKDAFKFFDALVGEKAAMYHTAGALGLGERIWLLAKLPGIIEVTKDDNVEKFLLLHNSHNGLSTVEIMFTPIRVVCQNTLNVSLKTGDKSSIKHTGQLGMSIESVRKELGIAQDYYKMFEQMSQFLVKKQTNAEIVEEVLKSIGIGKKEAENSTRTQNMRYEVQNLITSGTGNNTPEVKGTAWGLWNGISEWVDYKRTSRGESDNRTISLLFKSGAQLKQKALDTILSD